MATAPLYNQEAERVGEAQLSDAVFGILPKASVVHQAAVAQMANQRRPWAHTKRRGEVSGGGKKPWRQKGTGRARHGSIRSPLWKGGGVVFGPTPARNYHQKLNKKMNRAALRMCLSDRAVHERFLVVEDLPSDGKTKTLAGFRSKLPGATKSTLLVLAERDEAVNRAARNVREILTVRASDMNILDVLNHQYMIATRQAVSALEARLLGAN